MPSNAPAVPAATGSGTDQCSQPCRSPSSSWAWSHTVTTSGAARRRERAGRHGVVQVETGALGGRARRRGGPVPRDGCPAEERRRTDQLRPQRRGELAAGRVGRAHEQRRLRPARRGRGPGRQGVAVEVDVASAAVARRTVAGDEADVLEHVEVVGQQVRREVDAVAQLDRGPVRHRQLVDDRQPGGVPERGVALGSQLQVGARHADSMITQSRLSQLLTSERPPWRPRHPKSHRSCARSSHDR